MIGKLRGTVEEINEDHCVIDVNGVGYVAFCSSRTLQGLSAIGKPQTLFVETCVREDMIRLFGFHCPAEREWFRLLITNVQGVGARVALSILSNLSFEELTEAVTLRVGTTLSRVPGIGKKIAERIITELQGKNLPYWDKQNSLTPEKQDLNRMPLSDTLGDALSVLINLGYSRNAALNALSQARKIAGSDSDSSVLIKLGLKELSS